MNRKCCCFHCAPVKHSSITKPIYKLDGCCNLTALPNAFSTRRVNIFPKATVHLKLWRKHSRSWAESSCKSLTEFAKKGHFPNLCNLFLSEQSFALVLQVMCNVNYFQSDQDLSRLGWALPRLPQSLFWSLNHSDVLFCWHPTWLGPLILCVWTASSSHGLCKWDLKYLSVQLQVWDGLMTPTLESCASFAPVTYCAVLPCHPPGDCRKDSSRKPLLCLHLPPKIYGALYSLPVL